MPKQAGVTAVRRALISTANKAGIVEFATQLAKHQIEIVATAGTAGLLCSHGISVTEVSDYTGFPEILEGRLKTLHPKIHGGILARRDTHSETLKTHHIPPIDLVVINLYPFSKTIADPRCGLEQAIEQIDIGGPTLLRGGAKNYRDITVVVTPADYALISSELDTHGGTTLHTRQQLATKAFAHTAEYDAVIADYFKRQQTSSKPIPADLDTKTTTQSFHFPTHFSLPFTLKSTLRYGENPHQHAALYQSPDENNFLFNAKTNADTPPNTTPPAGITNAVQIQGKALSYNNLVDADAALKTVSAHLHQQPTCVIIKHASPCGIASAATLTEAYENAYRTDTTSAFGGIIAFNSTLDSSTVEHILSKQFVEAIIAPALSEDAKEKLSAKPAIRVLVTPLLQNQAHTLELQTLSGGGILIQAPNAVDILPEQLQVMTKRQPTANEVADLIFAWKAVKYVKSNAIVYAKQQATLGIGVGQASRVFSAKIAALKAQAADLSLIGAVMASDAFFPFQDSITLAKSIGITAVIQPGGSKRDEEVIAAANEANIAMVFTGIRQFYH